MMFLLDKEHVTCLQDLRNTARGSEPGVHALTLGRSHLFLEPLSSKEQGQSWLDQCFSHPWGSLRGP